MKTRLPCPIPAFFLPSRRLFTGIWRVPILEAMAEPAWKTPLEESDEPEGGYSGVVRKEAEEELVRLRAEIERLKNRA